jgi:CRISPR-associated protein Cas2
MNHERKMYIVCYDITDPRRLKKVYDVMRGWGDHLQYSVFRCVLSPKQLAQLESDLTAVIADSEDQVLIVPLGSEESRLAHRMYTLGVALTHPERVVQVF